MSVQPLHNLVDSESASWDASVHFLTAASCELDEPSSAEDNNSDKAASDHRPLSKQELLEYVIQTDGSVICKWCGESVPSRTHWYRHKYRLHAVNLFRCGKCFVYFKTKKGYLGHINNSHKGGWKKWRHAAEKVQVAVEKSKAAVVLPPSEKMEKIVEAPSPTLRKRQKQEWGAQESEEKLIADIIERVKREFEAQGDEAAVGQTKDQGYNCRRKQVSSQ